MTDCSPMICFLFSWWEFSCFTSGFSALVLNIKNTSLTHSLLHLLFLINICFNRLFLHLSSFSIIFPSLLSCYPFFFLPIFSFSSTSFLVFLSSSWTSSLHLTGLTGASSLSGEPVAEGRTGRRSAAAAGQGAGGGHPGGAEPTPAVYVIHTQIRPGWTTSGEDKRHSNPNSCVNVQEEGCCS